MGFKTKQTKIITITSLLILSLNRFAILQNGLHNLNYRKCRSKFLLDPCGFQPDDAASGSYETSANVKASRHENVITNSLDAA
jgi:hypothetical protein